MVRGGVVASRKLMYVLAFLLVAILPAPARAFTTPDIPTLEGPITGPGNMHSGLVGTPSTTTPLEDFGYVAQEYFVSGTAGTQAYKTRILVRRPQVESMFSGIVVSEVMHSNGTSVTFGPARKSVMLRGHIHVEIAAQTANITTLKNSNSTRYQTLSIPSSSQLAQIVAQVGTLIKSNLITGPLQPSVARHLILMGTSNASAALRTYQTLHFTSRMPDGSAIFDGYFATSTLGNAPMMVVDVPTVHMPTQTEVTSGAATATGLNFRRADSDDPANPYRIYEVAGLAHANARDTVTYIPNPCNLPVSDMPWGALMAMGINHLVEWVDHGILPPHAPWIIVDRDTTGDGSLLALDVQGNALGGVRNTYVDVPVAKYGVPNSASGASAFVCSIAGYRLPFPVTDLPILYSTRNQYVSQVSARLTELVDEGWFLPEYVDDVMADAVNASMTFPRPVGDLNNDGDVDSNDLNVLLSYRGSPASVCPLCDLDNDGMITALDSRKLVNLCTRPRCATR